MTMAIAKVSATVSAMRAKSAIGRALMGGTAAMRDAGTAYLPQMPKETTEAYRERLGLSWLFNGFRKTVRDMTGKIFAKPVELTEGASERIASWLENVDMQGRDLSTFAHDICEDALAGPGVSYIMVDAPPRSGVVTQAQANSEGLRPYFVHLSVDDVLGWTTDTVANVTVLRQFRIAEKVAVPDPKDEFGEIMVDQIRVLDLTDAGVSVRLFRKIKKDGAEWAQVDEPFMTGLAEITVVPFYANRTGFFTGEPLLDDLAFVNVAHWQSQSDQRMILHYARVPILFGAGFTSEDKITFSASMAVMTGNEAANLQWVEHSGQAIAAGRQDLKDLEFQMEALGLQLLEARPSAQSATGEALDAGKETSQLSAIADSLKNTMEKAISYMAMYAGEDAAPVVDVNKEFGVNMIGAQEVTALLGAVNTGNLSRETFIGELARRGMIKPDVNADDEMERIEGEGGLPPGDMNDGE